VTTAYKLEAGQFQRRYVVGAIPKKEVAKCRTS